MYAKNIPLADLQQVAGELEFDLNAENRGNQIKFNLRPKQGATKFRKMNPQPTDYGDFFAGRKITWKWRKGNSICFHGHYEFINRVLQRNPQGVIKSSYYGAINYTVETFEKRAHELGNSRMGRDGNIYHVFKMRDMCYCEHPLYEQWEQLREDGSTRMTFEQFQACS
jgi:hypothetical protein